VALAVVFELSLQADSPPAAPEGSGTPFTGKVLEIVTRSSFEYAVIVEDVAMKTVAGERFLAGKAVEDDANGPSSGHTVWIAFADVSQVVEFESREDYLKSKERADGGEARNATFKKWRRQGQ
jgi:hypothetical protein